MEQQDIPVKKKRGRKPKNSVENTNNANNEVPAAPKKRGRKPKGGKLINKISDYSEKPLEINNVILHLKCSINDIITNPFNTTSNISYNPNIPPPIESFNIESMEVWNVLNDKCLIKLIDSPMKDKETDDEVIKELQKKT